MMSEIPTNLEKVKKDELDREIVRLLAERASLLPRVVEAKKKAGIPLSDTRREIEVLEKVAAEALRWKADPEYVKCIYKAIIECTLRLEGKFYRGEVSGKP